MESKDIFILFLFCWSLSILIFNLYVKYKMYRIYKEGTEKLNRLILENNHS
jgi:hypothetical protein